MDTTGAELKQHIPFVGRWDYSRGELLADGVVHLVGLIFAVIAGSALLFMSYMRTGSGEYAAAIFYVLSLISVLSVSLAYNQWPVSRSKWILRRIDHSMIYVLIAATYTPFLVQVENRTLGVACVIVVWLAAFTGIAIKLTMPGRYDRLALALYLGIGWSGVALAEPLLKALPSSTLHYLAIGGLTYTFGVIFYVWTRLKFHIAIWHACVVCGAAFHCIAVIDCLVVNRT